MIETIRPFHRPAEMASERSAWLRRVMQIHYALLGTLLFLGAVALAAYLYTEKFRWIDISSTLRIRRAGDIYEADIQLKLLLALLLLPASLIQFQAFKRLGQPSRQGRWVIHAANTILLAGAVAGVFLWSLELDIPGLSVSTVQLVLRIGAALLFLQAVLSLIYEAYLRRSRAQYARPAPRNRALAALQRVGTGLWILSVAGLTLALALMTDVIDLPVPHPQPGELLYASTFDALTEEWDIHGGRDSVEVTDAPGLDLAAGEAALVEGGLLVVRHGSPYPGEIVWSALDRKFNDFDLRVTAQRVAGPVDNQYGVIFRYRDGQNFYVFLISSDGWYSLVKVKDDVQEVISEWNQSDVIRQENGANEIRVVARGDEFRFYVNGTPMPLCFKGENAYSMWTAGKCDTSTESYIYKDSDFKQGRIALVTGTIDGSEVTVAFDDLLIVGPDPDVMAVTLPE
jgi:hypothetical protein